MIKHIIFDFGNVLARFYPDELSAPYVTDAEEKKLICDIVFDRLYWDILDIGSISDEEVRNGIRSRLPENLHEKACAVYDNWVKNLTPVKGMQELVADIAKTDSKIYLLSNISKLFADTYSEVEWIQKLFSNFDGIVLSGPIGKIKPNKDIFDHITEKFDIDKNDCIFIDDSSINIEGAKKAGINGYLFDGNADKLREFLFK